MHSHITREETNESAVETISDGSEADDDTSEEEKSLDEIIEAYTE